MQRTNEIQTDNKNTINNDQHLGSENIFQIPDIYKLDYRGKNEEETKEIMKKYNQEKYKDLYSFKIEELLELEKYLKSKLYGQDKVIDQYISNFLLYTYRNEENSKHLSLFFNFGPTGVGKNEILRLIADKLDFGYYCYSLEQTNYVEASTLLGASDGYSSNSEGIMENIYNISKKHDGRIILIWDEFEKGATSSDSNGNIAGFFTSIMNILDNRKVYTKNSNIELDFGNFIFCFNSNLGYDNYENKLMNNYNRIGFDIGDNNLKTQKKKVIDEKYIENYLKHTLKVQKSVFARLRKGNNFVFFNHLDKNAFKNYLNKKYFELINDIENNFVVKGKLPRLSFFNKEIDNFDFDKGFRGINNFVNLDLKLILLKKFIFKSYFQKKLKVGIGK